MRSRKAFITLVLFPFLAQGTSAQPQRAPEHESVPLCTHSHDESGRAASGAIWPIGWSVLGEAAIVLEYPSVYSVHTAPDPNKPVRSQPGSFFVGNILENLVCFVDADAYDFVLMYSLDEVPGWIHAGPRGIQAPAKNIGLPNSQVGQPSDFASWPKLLLAPHMNSLELTLQQNDPDFGLRTAMHEMGHAWNVFWAQDSSGPLAWQSDDPLAWLASCCSHWSWNWVDPQLPGMMYSAPTDSVFNDLDLYAMGLLPFEDARFASYEIYEDSGSGPPGPTHTLTLDDLLFSLSLRGPEYFEGDGRRIPATDPNAADLTILLVVIKGADESLSAAHEEAVADLAEALPQAWALATQNRSSLTVEVIRSQPIDGDADDILDCADNCPNAANFSQQNTDGDALGDACDPCPNVAHPSFFDLDRVLPFTLHDVAIFQNCFSGPFLLANGCSFVDFSGGGRIDLSDFVPLGQLLSGQCE